jgi:hypothetical protein
MPHSVTKSKGTRDGGEKSGKSHLNKVTSRYTVGLAPALATEVQHYADTVDTSMSKAIAALVRLGLENQENRKREFFKKLKENLDDEDPSHQDRLVDDFRTLILGR